MQHVELHEWLKKHHFEKCLHSLLQLGIECVEDLKRVYQHPNLKQNLIDKLNEVFEETYVYRFVEECIINFDKSEWINLNEYVSDTMKQVFESRNHTCNDIQKYNNVYTIIHEALKMCKKNYNNIDSPPIKDINIISNWCINNNGLTQTNVKECFICVEMDLICKNLNKLIGLLQEAANWYQQKMHRLVKIKRMFIIFLLYIC